MNISRPLLLTAVALAGIAYYKWSDRLPYLTGHGSLLQSEQMPPRHDYSGMQQSNYGYGYQNSGGIGRVGNPNVSGAPMTRQYSAPSYHSQPYRAPMR